VYNIFCLDFKSETKNLKLVSNGVASLSKTKYYFDFVSCRESVWKYISWTF